MKQNRGPMAGDDATLIKWSRVSADRGSYC